MLVKQCHKPAPRELLLQVAPRVIIHGLIIAEHAASVLALEWLELRTLGKQKTFGKEQ